MAVASLLSEIVINSRAVNRLRSGHVWIYQSDLAGTPRSEPGSLVQVADPRGKILGAALYSSSSQIALRMLTRDLLSAPIHSEGDLLQLTRKRIAEAIGYRSRV